MDTVADPQVKAVLRKFFDYDKVCFAKCVDVPDRRLTPKQETCLSSLISFF